MDIVTALRYLDITADRIIRGEIVKPPQFPIRPTVAGFGRPGKKWRILWIVLAIAAGCWLTFQICKIGATLWEDAEDCLGE